MGFSLVLVVDLDVVCYFFQLFLKCFATGLVCFFSFVVLWFLFLINNCGFGFILLIFFVPLNNWSESSFDFPFTLFVFLFTPCHSLQQNLMYNLISLFVWCCLNAIKTRISWTVVVVALTIFHHFLSMFFVEHVSFNVFCWACFYVFYFYFYYFFLFCFNIVYVILGLLNVCK